MVGAGHAVFAILVQPTVQYRRPLVRSNTSKTESHICFLYSLFVSLSSLSLSPSLYTFLSPHSPIHRVLWSCSLVLTLVLAIVSSGVERSILLIPLSVAC